MVERALLLAQMRLSSSISMVRAIAQAEYSNRSSDYLPGTSITVFGLASPATAPLSISLDENVEEVSHPNTNASLNRIVLFQASQLPQQLHSLQIQHAGDDSELLAMTGVEIRPREGEEASSLPCDAIANVPSLSVVFQ